MAKRRINEQQQRRIKSIQQKRREKAAINQQKKTDRLSQQGLGAEQRGQIITHFGQSLLVENAQGALYRCTARQNLGALVCGDQVIWQAAINNLRDTQGDTQGSNHGDNQVNNQGVIIAVEPRQSLLQKPGFGGKLKPMAANINQIVIVSAVQPTPNPYLIDRYLIAAENLPATPIILINKIDLLDDANRQQIEQLIKNYRSIGYQVISASNISDHGFDELLNALKTHTSIFVGLSGVGKSSLINQLIPELNIRVGELSEASGEGTHTTTSSTLYKLPGEGHLIDSPGVRDFGLWNTSADDILYGFIEFRDYIGHCKFSNCSHLHEPGCAIQQSLNEGRISQQRFDHYQKIVREYVE